MTSFIEMKHQPKETTILVEKQAQNMFEKMFNPSFYKEAYKRVSSHYLTKYYIFCDIFATIICGIISSQIMIKISEGNGEYVKYHIGIMLFILLFNNFVLKMMSTEIGITTTNTFICDANKLYSKVHYEERANKTAPGAKEKKDSAKISFAMVSDWGIPTLISLVGTGMSVITIFLVKKMLVQFIICSLVGIVFYYVYVKRKQDAFTELDKTSRKNIQRIRELVQLKIISFQGGETTESEISNLETEIETKRNNVTKEWIYIGTIVTLVNELISMLIIVVSTTNLSQILLYYLGFGKQVSLNTPNTQDYMLFSMVLLQWSGAVSSMIHFLTQLNGIKSDFENFVDYWKDVRFAEEPIKMNIEHKLAITGYFVKRNEQIFRFDNEITEIPFNIGRKYLILGPTGHGKSTFVNAILGKNSGMTMNIGDPTNYYHHIADMFQAIREKMPSSKITIRDWFKNEQDNNFIMRMLLITLEQKKVEEMMASFEKRGEGKHAFDVEINEEISGGQKTALCLATRCYEIEKFNKKVLVLDEPEQGLGRRAVKVLNNIYEKYKDITIINSTHLYKFELEALKCKFDLIFWIEHGIVKSYKSLKEMEFLDSLDYE